jgi:hypothetical protein
MTSDKVVAPRLRRFLTSARSLRALAAFSRAAARSSGVRGGRATRGHLGFRREKGLSGGETSQSSTLSATQIPVYVITNLNILLSVCNALLSVIITPPYPCTTSHRAIPRSKTSSFQPKPSRPERPGATPARRGFRDDLRDSHGLSASPSRVAGCCGGMTRPVP